MALNSDNKSPKRPGQSGTLLGVRLQPDALGALDAWITAQADPPSRPEAVRRLIEHALQGGLGSVEPDLLVRLNAAFQAGGMGLALRGEQDALRADCLNEFQAKDLSPADALEVMSAAGEAAWVYIYERRAYEEMAAHRPPEAPKARVKRKPKG